MQFWSAQELVEAYGASEVEPEEVEELQLDVNCEVEKTQQQLPLLLPVDWEEALQKGFYESPLETPGLPVKKMEALISVRQKFWMLYTVYSEEGSDKNTYALHQETFLYSLQSTQMKEPFFWSSCG